MTYEYEGLRRKVYGGGLCFIPVCPTCRRFVRSDYSVEINMLDELKQEPNATCAKCGRVMMPCEGWIDY